MSTGGSGFMTLIHKASNVRLAYLQAHGITAPGPLGVSSNENPYHGWKGRLSFYELHNSYSWGQYMPTIASTAAVPEPRDAWVWLTSSLREGTVNMVLVRRAASGRVGVSPFDFAHAVIEPWEPEKESISIEGMWLPKHFTFDNATRGPMEFPESYPPNKPNFGTPEEPTTTKETP